ncbi:MAG: hypothetical protein K0R24_1662 [Gammaproteobacteria bacterium]|jgi:hypothetical protein|nr:hypothetical protein [Gammaproteobacteria bacterium]MCE3238681.1 hypothetical protein [Gammaproteobacteria bacterium]
MNDYADLEKKILQLLSEDCIGLWEIIRLIKKKYPGLSPKDTKEITLQFIFQMLSQNIFYAGIPQKDGSFVFWVGKPDELTKKIKESWDTLDSEPNIGEIVWFDITNVKRDELKQRIN